MDRDYVFKSARYLYPIAAAILSSLLNFLAFMIAIKWNQKSFFQVAALALFGTLLIYATILWAIRTKSFSANTDEITILKSIDEYRILDRTATIYKRTITAKANQKTNFMILYPPKVDGKVRKYKCYDPDNPSHEYHITKSKISGKSAFMLNIGHPLKKREVIKNICMELEILNTFEDEQEGVSVSTDPGQENCTIKVEIPKITPLTSPTAEWFVLYGRNRTPLSNGVIVSSHTESGDVIVEKDFSDNIKAKMGLQCSVNWRWKI